MNRSDVEFIVRQMLAAPQGVLTNQFQPFLGPGRNSTGRTPECRVYHNATQTSANGGVSTAMTFNSERYDTDQMHDTVTNPTRITIRTPGKYSVGANLLYPVDGTGNYRALRIRVTTAAGVTTDIALEQEAPIAAVVGAGMNIDAEWVMGAGDYFTLITLHNATPATLTIPASTGFECEFWASLSGNV